MSTSLDTFFGSPAPQQTESTGVQPQCFKCHRSIPDDQTKFTLPVKGKPELHCRDCAKKILKPQENNEENL